jgi:hypothetical protein
VNQDPVGAPVPPSAAAAPTENDNSARDYITVEDILQEMPDSADGGGDGQEFTMKEPEDVQLVEDLVNHIDEDDVVFGSPKWLENFREIKQAVVDPLYKAAVVVRRSARRSVLTSSC